MRRLHPGLHLGCAAVLLLGASPPPAGLSARPPSLATLEADFLRFRDQKDQLDVTRARGADQAEDGTALAALSDRWRALRVSLGSALDKAAPPRKEADRRALETMRRAVAEAEEPEANDSTTELDCAYDAEALAGGSRGAAALRERAYACYGRAARSVAFEGETLDRLTVLGRLGQTEDPDLRRRLFLALDPVWRTMNRDGAPGSPYRVLARRERERWQGPDSPPARKARELGITPETLERWLVQVLEAWRDAHPDPLEPWDYWFSTERASRALNAHAPRERLREINDRFYRSLGADPVELGTRYDLDPRPGKTPVAFTTFGARSRRGRNGWSRGSAWIFATYRAGGLGNLVELLHETGHAVHITAIRARPAFADWPDSDVFTEAIADLIALEAYEPEWQRAYLGADVALPESMTAKYASIVLDVAWGLFEWRVHRDPEADPNQVWTQLTQEYLHVRPHPEWSWWALRGQLIDSPGYMMNYAAGAFLTADLRARCRELRGPFSRPDPGSYAWLSERLFRFGLERPSRQVTEDFLGRPLGSDAMLTDLKRAQPSP